MNRLTKRMIALLAAVGCFTTSFNAFATYVSENGEIPESGVLFSDDFEEFDESRYVSRYDASVIQLDDGNKVMASKPLLKNQTAASGFYINLNSLGYDKDYTTCIRDGQLLISQNVYVPSHTQRGELIEYDDSKSTYSQYLMNYGLTKDAKPATYGTASWSKAGAIFYAVYYSNENPWISFNKNSSNSVANKDTGYVVDIEPNTWYNIECCIDYDNSTISYYCNGEYIGDYAGADASTVIPDLYGTFQLQMSASGTFDEQSEHPEIYFDDYSVTRLSANSFSIDFEGYGNNYVDLKCNYSIDKDYLQKLNASAVSICAGEDRFAAESYELVSNDVIRFYFDTEIISNGIYNIVIGDKTDRSTYIRAIYGSVYGSVEPGHEISFIPQEEVTEEKIELINLDFNDESDFATEDNSTDFTKYTYVRNRKNEEYDFVEDAENTYKYCYADDDLRGGNLLNLDLSDTDGATADPDGTKRNMKAVRFPFADDKKIVGGTIYIDFDAGVFANANSGKRQSLRLLFGLENALTRETTHIFRGDRADERWSNSSCLFGLSYWTDKQHALTYPKEEYRTRTCDWQRENNGAKTDNQVMLINDGELHHYSVKLDISKKRYEFSVDGGTKTAVGYLPGGESRVKYNAFVMTLSDPGSVVSGMAKLDNLTVKIPGARTPNVEKVQFYDLSGNEIAFSNTMPSSTSKIRLKFNQEVVADKNDIIITGLDEDDYAVSYGFDDGVESKRVLDIELLNCLNNDSRYMFTLSSSTVMAESGDIFGRDFTFSFERGSDDGLNYVEPVLDKNSNTAEAKVMNFTDESVTGYVTIVGYTTDGETLKVCGIKCNSFEVAPNTVFDVVSSENADVQDIMDAGASRIAIYVFDGEDTLNLNTYKSFTIE